ncbi:MAG TPA: PAS domain S-box protein, partial [Longimicrobium sp.]|nr:PAS domain S-box protein [Longimicrobium sp.]
MVQAAVDGAAKLFAGQGEVRALCRAKDWAATPLGPVDTWPQSLRTAAGLALGSTFPSIVLWGPELVQLYNDGYVAFLGVKHPWALGIPTHACWAEVRSATEPIYRRVLAGETVFMQDELYALHRRGPDLPPDDVYITLCYSPIPGESGEPEGISVTLFDTTEQVAARGLQAALAESEARHRLAVEAAELGTWAWEVGRDEATFDARVRELFGFEGDEPVRRMDILSTRVHPDDADRVAAALRAATDPAGEGRYGVEYRVVRPGGGERWVAAAGVMLFDEGDGERRPLRLIGTVRDVTAHKHAEAELRRARDEARAAAAELARQSDEARGTAEALTAANARLREGAAELAAQARALDEANAELRASERRFRDVLEQAPVAVAVMEGPEHVYTLVSPRYAESPGGGRPLLGRTVREAFPEVEDQGFPALMDRVYESGE